jgi:hypothetical protein
VAEDQEVQKRELHKVCQEKTRDLHKVAKGDFNLDRWIWKGTWKRINASLVHKLEGVDSRGYRTCEVRTRDSITFVDRGKNEDHRSDLEVFTDSKIEKTKKETRESLEVRAHKGS